MGGLVLPRGRGFRAAFEKLSEWIAGPRAQENNPREIPRSQTAEAGPRNGMQPGIGLSGAEYGSKKGISPI
jgi:hypothetical protein